MMEGGEEIVQMGGREGGKAPHLVPFVSSCTMTPAVLRRQRVT